MLSDIQNMLLNSWPTQFSENMSGFLGFLMIALIMFITSKPVGIFIKNKSFQTLFVGGFGVWLFMENLYSLNSTPFLTGSIVVLYAYIVAAGIYLPLGFYLSDKAVSKTANA